MQLNIRKITIILVMFMIILTFCKKSEALYITIENIGSYPIIYVDMGFDIEPYQPGFDLQIWSLLHPDPTNYLLSIDWNNPIGVGEIYYTPLIPELTGANFNFEHFSISGPNIAMTVSGHIIDNVIPDLSKYTEYNPDIDFGATFSFYSDGVPFNPIPEPVTILLLGSGLLWIVAFRKKLKKN